MNYSDSIKAILLATINDLSKTPEKYAVKPGVDFIRNRKLGFKDYMLMFLTMEACLSVLYHFYDFPYCLMTVPVRPESKTLIVELRFINLFQYLCNRIFHQFILITGDSQWPHFAFCFFRNIDTPCWIRTIASAFHPFHKICEIFLQILFVIFFSHLINSIRFLPIHSFMDCSQRILIDVRRKILNLSVGSVCFRDIILYSKQLIYHVHQLSFVCIVLKHLKL